VFEWVGAVALINTVFLTPEMHAKDVFRFQTLPSNTCNPIPLCTLAKRIVFVSCVGGTHRLKRERESLKALVGRSESNGCKP
jgi:hypothetical protein